MFNSVPSTFRLRHNDSDDVLKVQAKVETMPHVETLTLSFPVIDGTMATMQLHWGRTAMHLDIEVP